MGYLRWVPVQTITLVLNASEASHYFWQTVYTDMVHTTLQHTA